MASAEESSVLFMVIGIFENTEMCYIIAAGVIKTVLLLLTLLYWGYRNWWSEDAAILCTVSESHQEKGIYLLQIDILLKKNAGKKLSQREKKGFKYMSDTIIGGGKCATFKVKKNSEITFTVEGALQHMTALHEGQMKLKCVNIKKGKISTQLHLKPDEDCEDNHGAIKFFHNGEFLNQMTITDIQKGDTLYKRTDSVRSNTLSSTGSATYRGNEVIPVAPRPPRGRNNEEGVRADERDETDDNNSGDRDVSVRRSRRSLSPDQADASSSMGLEGRSIAQSVFSDSSLQSLSEILGPPDSRKLLRQLKIPDADIQYAHDNHPRDGASAYVSLFIKWRTRELGRGDMTSLMGQMERSLTRIGRNDIKEVFLRCASENAELTRDDLGGILG